MSPIPNLAIIGAQKSGTTSLYHYLGGHPDIFMSSPVKEPAYYMSEEYVRRLFQRRVRRVRSREEALTRYMLCGYRGERYFGDASTDYTIGMRAELHGAPARMRRLQPGLKLIYIVRNPFERIVSTFLHESGVGYFDGSFRDYVDGRLYEVALRTSRYGYQLETYLKEFPQSQIEVVLFEDLVRDAQEVVEGILEFLDLSRTHAVSGEVYNRSDNRSQFTDAELRFPPHAYRKALRVLEEEVEKLAAFMGREPEAWDLSRRRWCGGASG